MKNYNNLRRACDAGAMKCCEEEKEEGRCLIQVERVGKFDFGESRGKSPSKYVYIMSCEVMTVTIDYLYLFLATPFSIITMDAPLYMYHHHHHRHAKLMSHACMP